MFVWCLVIPLHMLCRFMLRSHWPLFWLAELLLLVETSWCVAWSINQTFWTHSEIQISLARIFYIFIFLDLKLCMHMFYSSNFQRQKESCVRIHEGGVQVEGEPAAWLASHYLTQKLCWSFHNDGFPKYVTTVPLCCLVVGSFCKPW